MNDLIPTPEIAAALKRYLEIQEAEKALKEEKQVLQTVIAEYMARAGTDRWTPAVNGERLKIQRSVKVKVDYDEDLLRERLGPRFIELLVPDAKKMAQHQERASELLRPLMGEIGHIDRDQVKSAVEHGVVKVEEFAGAFQKSERPTVVVSRQK